jgi:hypothetical protein
VRGLEGGTETWIVGFGTGIVLSGLVFGGCVSRLTSGGSDPMGGANKDCEEAWVVANDGDDETVNETSILEQPWCIDHMAAEQAEETTP